MKTFDFHCALREGTEFTGRAVAISVVSAGRRGHAAGPSEGSAPTTVWYTPERVEQMTDAELGEAVAVHVFSAARFHVGAAVPYYVMLDGPFPWLLRAGATSPLLRVAPASPDVAVEVLSAMSQRWASAGTGTRWDIGEEVDDDGTRTWVVVARGEDGEQVASGESQSLGRAVFECALLAAVALASAGEVPHA